MGKYYRPAFFAAAVLAIVTCSSLASSPSAAMQNPAAPYPPLPLTLLYSTFQDHAVLQRGKPIPVWGLTNPGAVVTVTLAGRTAGATAGSDGHWRVVLPPLEAGGPYELVAKSTAGDTETVTDILIGDVFLCSGQSNMEMPLRLASNYDADVRSANNPNLRLFHVERFSSPSPLDSFAAAARWSVVSPETVREFSAVCYLFGRELQPVAKVPVGLVEAAWGGSVIQAWISEDKLRRLGGYDAVLDVLALYRRAPQEAAQRYRELAHAWWLSHDPASSADPPWSDPTYDDSAWESVTFEGSWRALPQLKTFFGTLWLRQEFQLTADQARSAAVLSLGAVDKTDTTWVNGREVGDGEGYDVKRDYQIPAGTLRAGRNLLAVGVMAGSGFTDPTAKVTLIFPDGSAIVLGGPWRFKTSAPLSRTGRGPHVPWLNQLGVSVLYNGMILPLGDTQFRAVLWYQGESDDWQPKEYARLLPAMIEDWRRRLSADMPFFIVQLPGYGAPVTQAGESNWAEIREVQRRAALRLPDTELAVTIDLGQRDNIHPTAKQEVGRRLALLAARRLYGADGVDRGPTPLSARRDRNTITVTFDHTAKGLKLYEWDRPIGFMLCNGAGKCRYAAGTAANDTVKLDASHLPDAVKVRFCWSDSPICNLYNSEGLPAGPFEMAVNPVHAAELKRN